LKSTFREARQVNHKRAQALSAEFLGEINYRKGNYHEAEAWLEKALELAKESAPRGDVAVEVYRRLGDVKAALGELDEAEEMLSEAHKLCEHLGDKYELGSVYRALGVVSVMRGDIDLARSFFNESITTQKMIGEKFELASTCKVAAEHYLDWSRGDDVSDVIRAKLIEDAHNLAVEAMHLYSSIKLSGRADGCRKLIREIGRMRRVGKDSVKTEEIVFRPEWLCRGALVARSEDMKAVITEVEQLAGTDIPIFISGETGTGKEVVARLIHGMSGRDSAPFVAVNCASIPDTVFESELFGHCRGAFTGADQDRIGLIEKAGGGTLFLDEVSSMPLEQQAKILRVLEDGKVRRVGETRDRRVDIRVVSASNGNIDRMIANDRLRKDFYYRIAAKRINLKPLRERREDIQPLLAYYASQNGNQFRFEEGILSALHNYFWPGNVRELVNLLRVLVNVREKSGIIYLRDLPTYMRDCTLRGSGSESLSSEIKLFQSKMRSSSLSAKEKERIEKLIASLLAKHSGNKTATARELGISRKTLYRYLDKLDISPLH
ncbi:MAG: sigma 54-interacting transcriptional regulator, partial [Candidatus Krumholzibacteriota bacterium]